MQFLQSIGSNIDTMEVVWRNVILIALYHIWALQGMYYMFTLKIYFSTFIWFYVVLYLSNFGIISGAHRLWTHRTYKAKLPLRLFLLFCVTISNQNSAYVWVRDHRVHHKFADTDADPHNINRGFFFAHMGWLLVRKHPDVLAKGKTVDLSDLENDKLIMFQHKYFLLSALMLSFVIPTVVPWYFWGENLYKSFCVSAMFRYVLSLHVTWLVNSVAHVWGTKPYDKKIKSVENFVVSYITNGEGFHNYHHTFPWDYKASEFTSYNGNLNTAFIDLMARIGWAYDLKSASQEMVDRTKMKNLKNFEQDTKETQGR